MDDHCGNAIEVGFGNMIDEIGIGHVAETFVVDNNIVALAQSGFS